MIRNIYLFILFIYLFESTARTAHRAFRALPFHTGRIRRVAMNNLNWSKDANCLYERYLFEINWKNLNIFINVSINLLCTSMYWFGKNTGGLEPHLVLITRRLWRTRKTIESSSNTVLRVARAGGLRTLVTERQATLLDCVWSELTKLPEQQPPARNDAHTADTRRVAHWVFALHEWLRVFALRALRRGLPSECSA